MMASANNTMVKYCSATGTQVCDSGTWMLTATEAYQFSWQSGASDTMTLSNGDLFPVAGSNAGLVATPTTCP
jgi:hypothetical protein